MIDDAKGTDARQGRGIVVDATFAAIDEVAGKGTKRTKECVGTAAAIQAVDATSAAGQRVIAIATLCDVVVVAAIQQAIAGPPYSLTSSDPPKVLSLPSDMTILSRP